MTQRSLADRYNADCQPIAQLAAEYTGPEAWAPLHNHTVFSKLDGIATPEQYAAECAKRNYPAMSATEHGNLGSVPDMYLAFKKRGVKFIAGCELYYSEHHPEYVQKLEANKSEVTPTYFLSSDDSDKWSDYLRLLRSRHLTVLAQDQTGFQNLLKLCTDVHRYGYQGQKGRSRTWFDMLTNYSEGLIVLSGCLNGPVSYELKRRAPKRIERIRGTKTGHYIAEKGEFDLDENRKRARKVMEQFARHFNRGGQTRYWVELQMPVVFDEDENTPFAYSGDGPDSGLMDKLVFQESVKLADELGLPYVITNDIHYIKRVHHRLQRLMMAIEQGRTIDDPELFASNSSHQYMKTRAELWGTFTHYGYGDGLSDPKGVFERMCDNSLAVADLCQELTIDQSSKTPHWKEEGDEDELLTQAVYQALHERDLWDCPDLYEIDGKQVTYKMQADIELERFISKGFASYFLITSDLVRYGRTKGFPFSPRGSAGGSLVCMLLGISSLDPLKWGLSFDRFMSPSRGGYLLKLKMPESVN